MDRAEYLARPETARALEELTDACFEVRERGAGTSAFPDAAKFLRDRGVDPPGTGTISVRHTVEEPGTQVEDLLPAAPEAEGLMKPAKPICDDGSDGCRPTNCKMINGEWVCSWTCHCP